MELTDDKIYEICESLSNDDLNSFVRTSKRNLRICESLLEKRMKKQIEYYMKKFSTKRDEYSYRKIITSLINTQAPNNKLYILKFEDEDGGESFINSPLFEGNLSRAILKAADFIYNSEEYKNSDYGIPTNLFRYIISNADDETFFIEDDKDEKYLIDEIYSMLSQNNSAFQFIES